MDNITIYGPSLCTTALDWIYTLNLPLVDREKIIMEYYDINKLELQKRIDEEEEYISNEFDEIFDDELAIFYLNKFLNNLGMIIGYDDIIIKQAYDFIYIGEIVKNKENYDEEKIKNFCKKYKLINPEFIKVFVEKN